MIVYQLLAKGESLNGWAFRARSEKLYGSKTSAEAAMPEFERRCLDGQRYFEASTPDSLETCIIELEVIP